MVKNSVRRLFHSMGYRVVRDRSDAPPVSFNKFHELVQAYEQRMNEIRGEATIPHSDVRSQLMARLQGTTPGEAYCIVEALAKTAHVEGDVCEYGVAQGETSALIATEISDTTKTLHLFDSFQGLPKPTEKDELKDDISSLGSMEAYEGKMSCPQDMVNARLRAVGFANERVEIHAGFIEELIQLDQKLPEQVSFAYVDFDLYEPIKIALEYLHGVTPPGAMLIVDDYDFFSTGAKTAVDEFIEATGSYDIEVPDSNIGYFAILTKRGS